MIHPNLVIFLKHKYLHELARFKVSNANLNCTLIKIYVYIYIFINCVASSLYHFIFYLIQCNVVKTITLYHLEFFHCIYLINQIKFFSLINKN